MHNYFFLSVFYCFLSLSSFSQPDSIQKILQKEISDTLAIKQLLSFTEQIYLSEPLIAIKVCEKAKLLSEKINFKSGLAQSLGWLGYLYQQKGNTMQALDCYFNSIKILEVLNDKKEISACYNGIGHIYNSQGKISEALDVYHKSLQLKEEVGDKKGKASCLNNIGNIYYNQGKIPEALEYFHKSLKIREEENDKQGIGLSLHNIASVYSEQRQFEEALIYFQRSLIINYEIENKRGITFSLAGIGKIYLGKKQLDSAFVYYDKGLKISEETGNKSSIANSLMNLGYVLKARKDFSGALKYFQQSLKIREETMDKEGIINSLNTIAEIQFTLQETEIALKNAKKCLEYSLQIGSPKNISTAAILLKKIYQQLNRPKEALAMYELFIKMNDSIQNDETKKASIRAQLNYEFEKRESLLKIERANERLIAETESKKQKIVIYSVSTGLLFMFLLVSIIFKSLQNNRKKNHIINQQKQLVEQKQKEILDSITYAKRIQLALLAHDDLLKNNINEYFVLYKPKDIVSGDFYWATVKDDHFYLSVCDSTGHGVPGAFMSLLNISFLNEAINEKNIVNPNEIFNHTRNRLISNLYREGSQDGMDAILVKFSKGENRITLTYSAANNCPVVIRNKETIRLAFDKMPIGKGITDDSFNNYEFNLQKGDLLFLSTDGFADQFGGKKNKKLKQKQLSEILLAYQHLPMIEQKNILEKKFNNWKGTNEQTDDVLIIGIRI